MPAAGEVHERVWAIGAACDVHLLHSRVLGYYTGTSAVDVLARDKPGVARPTLVGSCFLVRADVVQAEATDAAQFRARHARCGRRHIKNRRPGLPMYMFAGPARRFAPAALWGRPLVQDVC